MKTEKRRKRGNTPHSSITVPNQPVHIKQCKASDGASLCRDNVCDTAGARLGGPNTAQPIRGPDMKRTKPQDLLTG